MKYIALIAVLGILLLQASGAIPIDSVGGSLTIGLALLVAGLAVGIHEAWTKRRGVLGWIVNVVVSFFGMLVAATVAGPFVGILFSIASPGQTLMEAGGPMLSAALAAIMAVALLGSWGALRLVNRWRKT